MSTELGFGGDVGRVLSTWRARLFASITRPLCLTWAPNHCEPPTRPLSSQVLSSLPVKQKYKMTCWNKAFLISLRVAKFYNPQPHSLLFSYVLKISKEQICGLCSSSKEPWLDGKVNIRYGVYTLKTSQNDWLWQSPMPQSMSQSNFPQFYPFW